MCVCGCVPPGDSMAMALVQRRAPDAHNFLFPRRHPISGLEIMELRDDPRNSLNRPDNMYLHIDSLVYSFVHEFVIFFTHANAHMYKYVYIYTHV